MREGENKSRRSASSGDRRGQKKKRGKNGAGKKLAGVRRATCQLAEGYRPERRREKDPIFRKLAL